MPHRQACLYHLSVTSFWLSVSLSGGGGVFSCLPNGAVETTTPLSFGVYLLGKHLLSACCLWTGVEKMNSSQSTVPGGSYSGRGHLTDNQRARKPLGKWAVGEKLALVAAGPERLFWLQH